MVITKQFSEKNAQPMAGILVHMTEKYIFRYMRNCFWLLRNNYPKNTQPLIGI